MNGFERERHQSYLASVWDHLGNWVSSIIILMQTKILFGVLLMTALILLIGVIHFCSNCWKRYRVSNEYYGRTQAYLNLQKAKSTAPKRNIQPSLFS